MVAKPLIRKDIFYVPAIRGERKKYPLSTISTARFFALHANLQGLEFSQLKWADVWP
jgi:hypothetical protein